MPKTYDQKYTNFGQLAPIPEHYELIPEHYELIPEHYELISEHYELIPEHYELIPEYDEPVIIKRRFWQRFCIGVHVKDQIISKEIPVKKKCIPNVCQHQ